MEPPNPTAETAPPTEDSRRAIYLAALALGEEWLVECLWCGGPIPRDSSRVVYCSTECSQSCRFSGSFPLPVNRGMSRERVRKPEAYLGRAVRLYVRAASGRISGRNRGLVIQVRELPLSGQLAVVRWFHAGQSLGTGTYLLYRLRLLRREVTEKLLIWDAAFRLGG